MPATATPDVYAAPVGTDPDADGAAHGRPVSVREVHHHVPGSWHLVAVNEALHDLAERARVARTTAPDAGHFRFARLRPVAPAPLLDDVGTVEIGLQGAWVAAGGVPVSAAMVAFYAAQPPMRTSYAAACLDALVAAGRATRGAHAVYAPTTEELHP